MVHVGDDQRQYTYKFTGGIMDEEELLVAGPKLRVLHLPLC